MGHDPPIIYFAGPAQHSLCSWFAGHRVLESYANLIDKKKDPTTGDWYSEEGNLSRYRLTFQSMALDPGAFSNLTAERNGKPPIVTIDGYIRHAVEHGEFYDWCAAFDDITGGPDGNRKNWQRCLDSGVPRLMPVFHQGEPWSLLAEYVAGGHYVGIGLQRSGPRKQFNGAREFLDGAFARIPDGKWVHIFAGTSFLDYPATSVDSTTWLSETIAIMRTSGQARNPLRYLTQNHILKHVVLPSYAARAKAARWNKGATTGVAAGRGEQLGFDDVLNQLEER